MILGHTLTSMVHPGELASFPWNVWQYCRAFTAPLFLIVSGVVQVYANKRDETGIVLRGIIRRRIRWGSALVVIGYLLVMPRDSLFALKEISFSEWQYFLHVNILQLIGITLIFNTVLFAVTRSVQRYGQISLMLALCIFFLSPIVQMLQLENFLPMPIYQYLLFAYGSLFPIFPFAGYMFFGGWLGSVLYPNPQKLHQRIYQRKLLPISIPILIFGIAFFDVPLPFFYDVLRIQSASWPQIAFRLGGVLIIIAVLHFIMPLEHRYYRITTQLSSKAFYQYILHLIILYGIYWWDGPARLYPQSLSLSMGLILAVGIMVVCLVSAYVLAKFQLRYRKIYHWIQYALATAIALFLIIPR